MPHPAPVPHPRAADCDCALPPSRRDFLRKSALGLAAGATHSLWAPAVAAAPNPTNQSETLAAQLHRSLTPAQRQTLCFPFHHPLRDKVDNNWMITKTSIREALNPDQQDLVRQIYRSLHRPDFADRAMDQMVHDSDGKGFEGGTSVALFGAPESDGFEFVLTGRHCTRRCDGDSVAGAAFGGPIFYGHQAGTHDTEPADHPGNVFWFQAQRANEMFRALDGPQRATALIDGRGRPDRAAETVQLKRRTAGLAGLPVSDLTRDQRELFGKVLADLLAPFRQEDAQEALKLVEASGLEQLHLAFFKQQDLGGDGTWDVWQVEGPDMVWFFRGEPHVHCWAHIRAPGTA